MIAICKQEAPDVQLMPVDVNRRYIRSVNVFRIFRVIAYFSIGRLAPTFREKWLSYVFSEASGRFFCKLRQRSVKQREDWLKRDKEIRGRSPCWSNILFTLDRCFRPILARKSRYSAGSLPGHPAAAPANHAGSSHASG